MEQDPASRTVLQIGPGLSETGGMATVCRLMAGLEFGGSFHLDHFSTTCATEKRESFFARVIRHVRQVGALGQAIRERHAPIVHLHTCSGFSFYRSAVDAWAARRAGCRVVLHIHGAGFDRFYAEASFFEQLIIRRTLRKADAVIALSRGWAETLRTFAPSARMVVVENAVAEPKEIGNCEVLDVRTPKRLDRTSNSTPVGNRCHNGFRTSVSDACHFLMLARMDAWKGVDDLLAACGVLAKQGVGFRVTLAGPEGSAGNAAELARKISALGLEKQVRYVGSVDGASKEQLWNETDVLVQPSHQEGMPMSLLEALMRGIPAVATRVGAVPEVITDGREGILVAPRAVEELAGAMQRVIEDSAWRESLGKAGRELARRRFSLERFTRDLTGIYSKVIEGAPERCVPGQTRRASADPPGLITSKVLTTPP